MTETFASLLVAKGQLETSEADALEEEMYEAIQNVHRALSALEDAQRARDNLIRLFVDEYGVSYRPFAELLDMSHQRVAQIVKGKPDPEKETA